MAETGWRPSTADTLVMKGLVIIKNADGGANFQDIINSREHRVQTTLLPAIHVAFPIKLEVQWAHYVMTWDSTTATV